jgi:hypothetical protein
MFGLASNSAAAGMAELDRLMKVKHVKKLGTKGVGFPESFAVTKKHASRPKISSSAVKLGIAVKGGNKNEVYGLDCGNSGVTCTSSASSLWVENKLDKTKAVALSAVQQAMDNEAASVRTVRKSLCNAAEAAIARIEVKNERGAGLSMKKFKAFSAEYEKLVRNISSLQELYDEIALGDGDDPTDRRIEVVQAHIKFVEGHRRQIKTILNRSSQLATFSEVNLLNELASGQVLLKGSDITRHTTEAKRQSPRCDTNVLD